MRLLILCVFAMFSIAEAAEAVTAVGIYDSALLSDEGELSSLMDAADAQRSDQSVAWLSLSASTVHLNYQKRYREQGLKEQHAASVARFVLERSAATAELLQLRGDCAYRVYLNGERLAEGAYRRRQLAVMALSLQAGVNTIDVVSGRPADQEGWHNQLRMGTILLDQGYHDATAAFIECWLPTAMVGDRVALHAGGVELATLEARQRSKDAVLLAGLVPYRPGDDAYADAELQHAGGRLAIDLSPIAGLRDFEAETEASIQKHRTGSLQIDAPAGADVQVRMLRHAFPFGSAINAGMFHDEASYAARSEHMLAKGKTVTPWEEHRVLQQRYQELLKAHFNCAVHENSLKWYAVEKQQGRTQLLAADRALAFCEANDIAVRGHTLFWAVPKYTKGWRKQVFDTAPKDEIEGMVKSRAIGQTWYYRGRIDEWDFNNEMLHGRLYRDMLGDDIVGKMVEWAQIGNPQAKLYLNDYGILVNRCLDADSYVEQIRGLLDQGVNIAGIGCQSHFFGERIDLPLIRATLDKLGQFGLPIKVTEFDIDGTPERQARHFRGFYRTVFAHPSVNGILMWGFWEGRHWRKDTAPWLKDFTPKPAAEAYMKLIHEDWSTDWKGSADEHGKAVVPGAFYGLYEVTIDGQTSQRWHRKNDQVD